MLTGGSQGLTLAKPPVPFGLSLTADQWLYLVCLLCAAALYWAARNLVQGRIGRALVAIRDQPIAAETMGINGRGEGFTITAGNASQLSDGASASVIMSDKEAAKRGLKPLGIFRGFVVAGCEPDEMGIGPVFAVPRLLKRHGLKVDDIDLWELNEAFAVQVLYCRDKLGIDPEKINVNGGAISIGHPYGMTGARSPATR